jgi:pimeloyl-ACP methyl ester carboxylesterase
MGRLTRITVAGIPYGFQELSFDVGPVTLNYVAGPENDLPLVLIPGQMESWQGYKCVLPELAQRFEVFVPDLRGHGRSTRTPGQYSYNVCGDDLKCFLQDVVQRPAIIAGLSSGAVLAIWLAASVPDEVLAIIAEDPPIFSSIWPRIQDEKLMARNFQLAVDVLGNPGPRDVERYLSKVGVPVQGKPDLLRIPEFIVKVMFFMARLNRAVRPKMPYDVPFLPFNMRAGFKFLSEYDVDFSRSTLDGTLSKDFNPEDALQRVKCPVLLLWAHGYRHDTWGLVGALDEQDVERVKQLVEDVQVVDIPGAHEMHMVQPRRYLDEIVGFLDRLKEQHKLPAQS